MTSVKLRTPARRLSPVDAGFLYLERPNALLHIGGIAIVSGELSSGELVNCIKRRLPKLWRLAQRPMAVPFSIGHPTWEDAPDFDVRDHIQRWAIPSPGGTQELLEVAAQLLSRPLERSRPLWEMHVLEGFEGDRTAVVHKVHHCMIDGVSGARLFERMVDPAPGFEERAQMSTPRSA